MTGRVGTGEDGSCVLRSMGAAVALAAALWPAAGAEAGAAEPAPALVLGEVCTSSAASEIEVAVTGLPDGTRVTFTVTGGDTTHGPLTLQSFQGRTSVRIGFGERIETARAEAILRSDGDAVVETGEQLLTGSVSRPCWSTSK